MGDQLGVGHGYLNGFAALWILVVAVLIVLDYKCIPAQSELELVREQPSTVGLEAIFECSIELAFAPRAVLRRCLPGQLEIELHQAPPAAFEALAPYSRHAAEHPGFTPRPLSDLEFAQGLTARFRDLAFKKPAPDKEPRHRLDPEQVKRASETNPSAEVWTTGDGKLLLHARFKSRFRARRRGRFNLGVLAFHVRGPLGLARQTVFFRGNDRLRVEPAMASLSRTLQLVASKRWWDLGVTRVRHARGGQTEFESLRGYVPGDEPRTLDWKAFARHGKPMVRQYEPEHGQEVILLFDCGRRMGIPVVEPGLPEWTKLDHALDAGLEFAAAVLSQGDRVGLMAFDSKVLSFVAPARSGRQLLRLKQAVFDLAPSERESNLSAALDELNVRHRRRCLVIILTDLADPLGVEAEARALAHAGKQRLVFCALGDPDLVALATNKAAPGQELRANAARYLAGQRQAGFNKLARCARVLDLEATRTAGPLLTAWFQERRAL